MKKNIIINKMLNFMALGDSNGIPYENISAKKAKNKKFKIKKELRIDQNFFLSDKISDDTEHFIFTYLALINSRTATDFQINLKKQFKRWFVSFPAGIGKATLKSGIKTVLNMKNTGIYSAGNGPLMRSGVIGAYFHKDTESKKRQQFIHQSTIMTHTDPLAFLSSHFHADLVALLINHPSLINNKQSFIKKAVLLMMKTTSKTTIDEKSSEAWQNTINIVNTMQTKKRDVFFNDNFKNGVSGFILDTLTCVIASIYYDSDPFEVIEHCLSYGGDTDTTAAISASTFSAAYQCESKTTFIKNGVFAKRITNNWILRVINSFIFFFYCLFQLKNLI